MQHYLCLKASTEETLAKVVKVAHTPLLTQGQHKDLSSQALIAHLSLLFPFLFLFFSFFLNFKFVYVLSPVKYFSAMVT